MRKKIKLGLDQLQLTLLMPLWARAIETQKELPIIVDNKAVEIIGSIDYDFTILSKNLKEINRVSWIARSKKYDEIINRYIIKNPYGAIVNIGCGLDTYYERAINSSVHWYELDLPVVIDLKRKFFEESENRKFISGSFLNFNWFDQISHETNVLFISAGVFCYFDEWVIKDFFLSLINRFPISQLLFDVTSGYGVRIANELILKAGYDESLKMKWALKDKNVILSWDARLKLEGVYYTYQLKSLHLGFKNRIIATLSDLLKIQYIMHLSTK